MTAAKGSLLAAAFLLAFVSFALPPLAVIPSAVEGSAFALQSEILNFQFEILFPQLFPLRHQLKPLPPFPPKAGRRVASHKI